MHKLRRASLGAAIGIGVLAWGTSANAAATISLEVFDGATLIGSVSNVLGGTALRGIATE